MEVYGGWRERDRGLSSYRAAAKKPSRIVATDSSRSQQTCSRTKSATPVWGDIVTELQAKLCRGRRQRLWSGQMRATAGVREPDVAIAGKSLVVSFPSILNGAFWLYGRTKP